MPSPTDPPSAPSAPGPAPGRTRRTGPDGRRPSPTGPAALDDRYGRRRRRVTPIAVGCALVAALALAWLVWAGLHWSDPPVRGTLRTFQVVDAGSATATVEIAKDADVTAICTVTAKDRSFEVVGSTEVSVPPGDQRVVLVDAVVQTSSLSTAVEVVDCRTG